MTQRPSHRNAGRTLTFRAIDSSNNPLKVMWSDPPNARIQVKATVEAQQSSQVFLKGGAYRNADRTQTAYADNVTVNNRLLYRKAFDQGNFDFPLGWLSAGRHTVEFSLQASNYNPAKFWFGANEETFDPLGLTNEWRPVQSLYYGEMHTAGYDAQFMYGGADQGDDTSSRFVPSGDQPAEGWRLSDAETYSRPGTTLLNPPQGVCYTMASIVTAYARSAGIPARSVTATGLGGWAEHAFAEVFIPDLPQHGGTMAGSSSSANADADPWYVFDATDPKGNWASPTWQQHSQAIAPRAQYGRAYQVLNGFSNQFYATTTPVNWDFRADGELTTNALSVTTVYSSGPDFWLSRSGVTGWLGYWEKDVYRVNRTW